MRQLCKILCHSNAKSDPIIAQFVMNRCCANSPQLGRGLTLVIRIAGDEPERSLRELATRFTDTVNAEYSRVPGRGHKVPTPWEGDERWRCRAGVWLTRPGCDAGGTQLNLLFNTVASKNSR